MRERHCFIYLCSSRRKFIFYTNTLKRTGVGKRRFPDQKAFYATLHKKENKTTFTLVSLFSSPEKSHNFISSIISHYALSRKTKTANIIIISLKHTNRRTYSVSYAPPQLSLKILASPTPVLLHFPRKLHLGNQKDTEK